ncbi:hypothetical protein FEM08_35740 [Flavobacterium gilvum]|nr:hypothetical protein FEM08_35740 [Flavobacterium gilvum]
MDNVTLFSKKLTQRLQQLSNLLLQQKKTAPKFEAVYYVI